MFICEAVDVVLLVVSTTGLAGEVTGLELGLVVGVGDEGTSTAELELEPSADVTLELPTGDLSAPAELSAVELSAVELSAVELSSVEVNALVELSAVKLSTV